MSNMSNESTKREEHFVPDYYQTSANNFNYNNYNFYNNDLNNPIKDVYYEPHYHQYQQDVFYEPQQQHDQYTLNNLDQQYLNQTQFFNNDSLRSLSSSLTANGGGSSSSVSEENQQNNSTNVTLKRGYCADDDNQSSMRSSKKSKSIVTYREMREFFNLLDNHTIKEFLKRDRCHLVSDKYALAMVFTYFKRARFDLNEYTKMNFFLALYLANDIEEDVDEYKYEIFPWALGPKWRSKFQAFLRKRDMLLKLIDYRAIVSRKCCDEVMNLIAEHYAWKRTRASNHGGATRLYLIRKKHNENGVNENDFIDNDCLLPRGPSRTPRPCALCLIHNNPISLSNLNTPTNSLSTSTSSQTLTPSNSTLTTQQDQFN